MDEETIGHLGERLALAVMSQIAPGPVAHLSAGPFLKFPIDVVVGDYAVEIKALAAGGAKDEIRLGVDALEVKRAAAEYFRKTPMMVLVVVNRGTGRAQVYKREGFARYPANVMDLAADVGLEVADGVPEIAPGQEPAFAVLAAIAQVADPIHVPEVLLDWARRAEKLAEGYRPRYLDVPGWPKGLRAR